MEALPYGLGGEAAGRWRRRLTGEKIVPNRSSRARRALLLAGGCCLPLLMPTAAFAQQQQTPPDQTDQSTQQDQKKQQTVTPGEPNATKKDEGAIVVTGIRRSVQDSIQIKRNSASMVEAVSAEEIGKLPDNSIAESIARLPGLTAQRVAGRAQIVSIRGFSPDFTTVLLNGRQQASSGYNRAVEFDQYPSELLGSVVVYKTPDANISGMGLAGTVDLRTIRPLEYGKRAIAVNLRGELDQGGGRNSEMSKYGWRASASYIGQNEDGTLGWLIGFAHLDAPGHNDHTQNWYYENYGGYFGDASENILAGQEAFAYTSRDKRDGVMGTLEWKPSDSVHSVLDLYYSRFKQETAMHGAEWFSDAWNGVTNITVDQIANRNGTTYAQSGHVDNVQLLLRNDNNRRTDHLFSAGLNNDFKLAERTHLFADLSYSSNKRDETNIESYAGYGVGDSPDSRPLDSYDFFIPAMGFPQFTNFGLNYADASQVSLGGGGGWTSWGHDGLLSKPHVKETLGSGDLTLKQDLQGGFLSSLEAGVDFTHRHKTKTVGEFNLMLKNNRQEVLVDPRYLNDPTSLSFAGMGDVLDVNIVAALPVYYDTTDVTDTAHYDKSWGIKEDIATFKAKANIDSGDLHGNVGVQVVRQRQESSGLRINETVVPTVLEPVDQSATYTDVLPSLNLYYDLDSRNRIRFAAAKVMARPRMDDMRANLVPGFNGAVCAGSPGCQPGQEVHPWSASGGNPQLQPWRAKEVDVAYEWYGGKATYFSINAFNFWLDNYIYDQNRVFDFSSFPLPPDAQNIAQMCATCTISSLGTISQPANGQGGWVRGIEVSGAFEFGRIARLLDGFGAEGSIARSKYKLDPAASGAIGTLPGFSPWVYNVTGYYERNGFQARASYRFRSAFKGEVVSLFSNLATPRILADKQLDAQVAYTFQPGSRLNGLGIQLQVTNLLNSPYRTVNGNDLNFYERYGRQWFLGASYHF
jgi:iron complex outermembrane receptor protein